MDSNNDSFIQRFTKRVLMLKASKDARTLTHDWERDRQKSIRIFIIVFMVMILAIITTSIYFGINTDPTPLKTR